MERYEYDAVLHEMVDDGGAYVAFPWDIRQEFGKIEFDVGEVHFVKENHRHDIVQAVLIISFSLRLGQEPKDIMRLKAVVDGIVITEHRFLRVPVRLNGNWQEVDSSKVRIQTRQFRFSGAADTCKHSNRGHFRRLESRMERMQNTAREMQPEFIDFLSDFIEPFNFVELLVGAHHIDLIGNIGLVDFLDTIFFCSGILISRTEPIELFRHPHKSGILRHCLNKSQ